jgi:epoxyqueuosine reductase
LRAVETRLRELVGAKDDATDDARNAAKNAATNAPTRVAADDATENSANDPPDDQRPLTADCLQTRAYVDTGPLIERVYAKHAGIGWIGKNTCVINQKLGSWLFLGVILTSLKLSSELAADLLSADLPAPDRCGTCTRCIAACPTQAIVAPGELDARLCISYLTIEKRGEIPDDLRAGMGRHVFGCDICQDVCPWNRKAPVTSAGEFQPRAGLVNPQLEWLAEMQPEEFRTTFRGSPVRRAKLSGLRRNAVVAMGNSGDQKFLPTLKKLAEDADPIVAEHAKWAINRHLTKTVE